MLVSVGQVIRVRILAGVGIIPLYVLDVRGLVILREEKSVVPYEEVSK